MQKSIYPKKITQEILDKISNKDIDSVFINDIDSNPELINQIKEANPNIKIELVFKVFEGKELLDKFPDAKAVELKGNETQIENYYPVSPLHDGVRDEIKSVAKYLADLDIDNVWLDHLQFPTQWRKEEPVLMDTDYSDHAIKKFEEYIGEPIEGADLEEKFLHIDGSYYHEWLQFKSKAVNSMAKELKEIFAKPTGFFAVPWQDDEYGAGNKRLLGQDPEQLLKTLDDIAIMMYRKDLNKKPSWLKDTVDYFWQTGTHFLSIIQPTDSMAEDIKLASSPPARGVCLKDFEEAFKLGVDEQLYSS